MYWEEEGEGRRIYLIAAVSVFSINNLPYPFALFSESTSTAKALEFVAWGKDREEE